MKPFEFVLVIISVIVGLALTEFAIGVSYMIQNYRVAHFYWPHFVLMLAGLMSCLNYWAVVYKLRRIQVWSIADIGIVFLTGLIFYVITRIYFPNNEKFDFNYERHFRENVTSIFVLMVCFVFAAGLEAVVIRKVRGFRNFFPLFIFALIISSGIIITNEIYVNALTVVILVMETVYYSKTGKLVADQEKNLNALPTTKDP